MEKLKTFAILTILSPMLLSMTFYPWSGDWTTESHKGFQILYQQPDIQSLIQYRTLCMEGVETVCDFFSGSFKHEFDIYIHPNRNSLDSTWQLEWNYPDFQSECWMVASGVSKRMDLLSPMQWDEEACEHDYSNLPETQKLITHELIHVYLGQHNVSPNFSELYGLDWFVEGLATYASGQCDKKRMGEVKEAVQNTDYPETLDGFWSGNLRYGLSGSMVMFIDQAYGRNRLQELLKYNRKSDVLQILDLSEAELLKNWMEFILAYQP